MKLFILLAFGIIFQGTTLANSMNSLLVDSAQLQPIAPKLPAFNEINLNFKPIIKQNIFDSARLLTQNNKGSINQQFSLNQLQMVGFMQYKEINYAFLKTPFDVIKVKVGDFIKNGEVLKVEPERVEIVENIYQGNKHFYNKTIIKFNLPAEINYPGVIKP